MYAVLLPVHSLLRWFVLLPLICSIYLAGRGLIRKVPFTPWANTLRHWTATFAHLQLVIGVTIYFQSPLVMAKMPPGYTPVFDERIFFKYVHILLMALSVVLVTIGSSKAKRVAADQAKYSTILRWFIAGLVIIIVAIPWPFSPLAQRPYLRHF